MSPNPLPPRAEDGSPGGGSGRGGIGAAQAEGRAAHGPAHGKDKRRHPRLAYQTRVRLTAGPGGRAFRATLQSADVSLGGIFFQSQFSLKLGSELHVAFDLPDGKAVEADGVVVRVEQYDERRRSGRSGFAVRFTRLDQDAEIALASLFLAPRVREFAARWARSRGRTKVQGGEVDRLVDALITWELEKSAEETL